MAKAAQADIDETFSAMEQRMVALEQRVATSIDQRPPAPSGADVLAAGFAAHQREITVLRSRQATVESDLEACAKQLEKQLAASESHG
eukprot:SAG31_NODE_28501_length_409_cov_0.993548_1_plen_87_part_01